MHFETKSIHAGMRIDDETGAVVFRDRDSLHDEVLHVRKLVGIVALPFNSWLVLRSIRTLSARMRVRSENAIAVARFLTTQKRGSGVLSRTGIPSESRRRQTSRSRRSHWCASAPWRRHAPRGHPSVSDPEVVDVYGIVPPAARELTRRRRAASPLIQRGREVHRGRRRGRVTRSNRLRNRAERPHVAP